MRVMFAGTPAVAVPALNAIHDSPHELVGVLTRPPAPVGRKRTLTPSPVHTAAAQLGLPVVTDPPNSAAVLNILTDQQVDCVAVVAYGGLIREPALSTPPRGWVNLHFSLLPQWRGAAPVQHAIMAGDTHTGVTTFQIEEGLDTGPILGSLTEPIRETDTAGDLLERLARIGAPLLVDTLEALDAQTATPEPQPEAGTLAPSLHSAAGEIAWEQPAAAVDSTIRGLTPAPGAWTRDAGGGRFKIGPVSTIIGAPGENLPELAPGQVHVQGGAVVVGTGTAPVQLERLAPPGKPWMAASDWSRGLREEQVTFEVEK